ncbi:6,7-dimethyl-8-ribityllumazine synthase [Algimonas porphyrae]|uniref:6,7-dimethyl-8-ribityllumazine synthase n=1 Tax=Algimonas porphyrae TaxID=1128113 RepID=A0ABQ5UX36_9PROT|nr:6,7-dimethyl-8-ribityllumazine synthase [Algimonas porphyrae]GLQ19133.1 6,7-dimethyl-8-ribityllumazine synthase [Algimonas porphyrae]
MKVLVIEARFYEPISDMLLDGALDALATAGAEIFQVTVPGALEIPHVISFAEEAQAGYDAYVALGCVIRGETTHYDYVCQESARAIMDLAVDGQLAIGNGIITVENEEQALARADKTRKDKGGFAARAAMTMVEIRNELHEGQVS